MAFITLAGIKSYSISSVMIARTVLAAAILGALPGRGQIQQEPVLTKCGQVLRLSPEEARSQVPVKLKAVVTCYVPASQLFFVQDESSGVYIFPSPWPRDLSPGEVVEIQGVSGMGRFSPIVQLATARATGETRELEASLVALEELNSGRWDCQYVSVEAVVRGQSLEADHTRLELASGSARAVALVFGPQAAAVKLVDGRVRLTGVGGTFYSRDRLAGFGLFLQNWEGVEVVREPPGHPFLAPLRTSRTLAWFSPEGGAEHRVRLRGTVTFAGTNFFFLRDSEGAALVKTAERAQPRAGMTVEASGFARDPTGAAVIEHAAVRVLGSGAPPEPIPVPADRPLGEADAFALASLEAEVLHAPAGMGSGARPRFAAWHAGETFWVYPPKGAGGVPAGSRVRVAGIYLPEGLAPEGLGPGLWPRVAEDIEVIRKPPSPRGTSASRTVPLVVAGGSAAAAFVMLLALARARGRKAAAEREHGTLRSRVREVEHHLAQAAGARERLARDLHDHIIQSIYALGLKVDDCTQRIPKDPSRAQTQLRGVLEDVNGVIRELRNVIHGIESNVIQPQEFKTALKSLALTLGQDQSGRIRLDIDQGAAELLTPGQATELVHIAREALSNSLRHAAAETTTLRLEKGESSLQFLIEDDGKGFDPGEAGRKGFGLRNMARRADGLRAGFLIESGPGKGTTIKLDIPRQKQHF